MVKKLAVLGIVAIMLMGVFWLAGCGTSQYIPNGDYGKQTVAENASFTYTLLQKENHDDYFWRIKGNSAIWYASNQRSLECVIVEDCGEIYFVYDGDEHTEAYKRLIKYDNISKKITVFL
jgi:hypothetical protein